MRWLSMRCCRTVPAAALSCSVRPLDCQFTLRSRTRMPAFPAFGPRAPGPRQGPWAQGPGPRLHAPARGRPGPGNTMPFSRSSAGYLKRSVLCPTQQTTACIPYNSKNRHCSTCAPSAKTMTPRPSPRILSIRPWSRDPGPGPRAPSPGARAPGPGPRAPCPVPGPRDAPGPRARAPGPGPRAPDHGPWALPGPRALGPDPGPRGRAPGPGPRAPCPGPRALGQPRPGHVGTETHSASAHCTPARESCPMRFGARSLLR